jgi:hypothetical protein
VFNIDPRRVQGYVRLARRKKRERLALVAFLYIIINNSYIVNYASLTTITLKSTAKRTYSIFEYKLLSVDFINNIIGVYMLPY